MGAATVKLLFFRAVSMYLDIAGNAWGQGSSLKFPFSKKKKYFVY